MPGMLRSVISSVLVLSVLAVGAAQQQPPAGQLVVERFVEALSAGDVYTLRQVLSPSMAWSERDLYWRVTSGEFHPMMHALRLVGDAVRLEAESLAVVGDGNVVIARERMWGDFVPEGMAYLRSTTVYLVEGERLTGITRVLDADQRQQLAAVHAVGLWRTSRDIYIRINADGTYASYLGRESFQADAPDDSGTYHWEDGVTVFVSGEDSRWCNPGERSPALVQALDANRLHASNLTLLDRIECEAQRQGATSAIYVRLTED